VQEWLGVDPYAAHDMSGSPYSSMYNDPISFSDPEGDCPWCFIFPLIGNILPAATVTATAATTFTAAATAIAATAATAAITIPTLNPVAVPSHSTLPSVADIYKGNYGYVDQAYDLRTNSLTSFGKVEAQEGYRTLYRTSLGQWQDDASAFLIRTERLSLAYTNSIAKYASLGGVQGMLGHGLGFAATSLGGSAVFAGINYAARTAAAARAVSQGTNVVYQGLDAAGKVRYIGITSRTPALRFAEHLNSFGTGKELLRYDVIKGAEGLSITGARVWEQTLINQYGLQKNGGLLLNRINSIAPKNWWQYGIK
jgi:hypothetical protein